MIRRILLVVIVTVFMAGCADKLAEYNRPAIYWYNQMMDAIGDGNLEKADNYYSSLQSEHIGSPLLKEATIILAVAHMYQEEYLLSEHFLNEYLRRYANDNEREYAEFLKIKAKYMALPFPRRDQMLMQDAIIESEKFQMNYPNSMYNPIIDTMVLRLYLAEAGLNECIASLYERLDKPKSAEYYRNIKPQPWINWDEVEPADISWMRDMFEGNCKGSWYGFMIPDTKSIMATEEMGAEDFSENLQEYIDETQDLTSQQPALPE